MDGYVRVKTGLSGAVPVEDRAFNHLQVARAGSTLKSDLQLRSGLITRDLPENLIRAQSRRISPKSRFRPPAGYGGF